MKKIKSFRLEDRVLFEADAVAQIVEAVNNQEASNQEHNTEEQNEETQQTFESIANIQGSIIDVSTDDSANNDDANSITDVYENLLNELVTSTVGNFDESVSNDLVHNNENDLLQNFSIMSDFSHDDLSTDLSDNTISHDDLFASNNDNDSDLSYDSYNNDNDNDSDLSHDSYNNDNDNDSDLSYDSYNNDNNYDELSNTHDELEVLEVKNDLLEVYDENLSVSNDHELFIVSSTLPDSEQLLEQLNAQLSPNSEILVLDGQGDALNEINAYLNKTEVPYSAIHIVSHGDDGELRLNGKTINASNINIDDWANIGNHLTENGDILFYGCNIAQTEAGRELLQTIADASGADILASEDTTGFHGNWDLEYSIGKVDATAISLDAYNHDLGTELAVLVNQTGDVDDGYGNGKTLREAVKYILANAKNYDSFKITFDSSVFSSKESCTITLTKTLDLKDTNLSNKLVTIDGTLDNDNKRIELDALCSGTDNDRKFTSILTASDSTSVYRFSLEHMILKGKNRDADDKITNYNCRIITLSGSDIELTLDDVTILNTYVMDNGGAISISATNNVTLNVTNSCIYDNYALGNGGGIYINATNEANVILENSEIYNNISFTNGGGIYVNATTNASVTLNASNIFQNQSNRNGGGIYIYSSTSAELKTDPAELKTEGELYKIYKNEAKFENGGGVYIASPKSITINLQSIEISENISRSNGGGLCINSGESASITLQDVSFSKNIAVNGGAIYSNGANDSLSITESHLTENHSITDGGAIYLSNGSVNIENSTLEKNEAGYKWAEYNAPYTTEDVLNAKSEVEEWIQKESAVREQYKNQGKTLDGPYYQNYARNLMRAMIKYKLILEGVVTAEIIKKEETFNNNNWWEGSVYEQHHTCLRYIDVNGIYHEDHYDDITCDAEGNSLYESLYPNGQDDDPSYVAGINVLKKLPIYNFSSLKTSNGYKTYARTGFEKVYGDGTMKGFDWYRQKEYEADSAHGQTLSIDSSTITENTTLANSTIKATTGNGGAIYTSGAVEAIGVTFANNKAGYESTAGNGGAIYATGAVSVSGTFTNNNATENGGAIYADNSVTISGTNNAFTSNNATNGGAIYTSGAVEAIGVTFANNTAGYESTAGNGGAIYALSDVTIEQSLLKANTANNNGGGIYAKDSTVSIVDSTLYGTTKGSALYTDGESSTVYIIGSTLTANTGVGIYAGATANNIYVANSILAGNTGNDIDGTATVNMAYTIYGTLDNDIILNSDEAIQYTSLENTIDDLFVEVENGVAQISDNGTVAIEKDGYAAYCGTLVGKIGNEYYYLDQEKNGSYQEGVWTSLTDLETTTTAFTTDATTNYGLGTDNTVYTIAQNNIVRDQGNLLSFNAGAMALNVADEVSLVVTTLNDLKNEYDGKITLRESIFYATLGKETIIRFADELFTDNKAIITLQDRYETLAIQTDTLEINASILNDDTTSSTRIVTIKVPITYTEDAENASNYRVITAQGEQAWTLSLNNLHISGGNVQGNKTEKNGGAILVDGSSVNITLDNVVLADSSATNGGALSVHAIENANVTLLYTTILHANAIESGGAVYINGTNSTLLTINTTIARNTANNGAGVYIEGEQSNTTLIDTTIAGNIATTAGGGIYANANTNTVIILNSILYANYSESIGGSGNTAGQDDILLRADATNKLYAAFSVYGASNIYLAEHVKFTKFNATNAVEFIQQNVSNIKANFKYIETVNGFVVPKFDEYNNSALVNNENAYTIAIVPGGAVGTRGTLIGKLDGHYYYNNLLQKQRIWQSFDTTTTYKFNASEKSYGLYNDRAEGEILLDAQNYNETERFSRINKTLNIFNIGAYALKNKDSHHDVDDPKKKKKKEEVPVWNVVEENFFIKYLVTKNFENEDLSFKRRKIWPMGIMLFVDTLSSSVLGVSEMSKYYALASGMELFLTQRDFSTLTMIVDNIPEEINPLNPDVQEKDMNITEHDARYEVDIESHMPEQAIVKILSMPNKARKFQSNYERILSDLQNSLI